MFRPDIYYNKDMTKKITAPVEEKDFILSFITSTLDFCKQNKKGVLTALGILVLAAVIGYAYSTHVKNVTEKSWASYYAAQVLNRLTRLIRLFRVRRRHNMPNF